MIWKDCGDTFPQPADSVFINAEGSYTIQIDSEITIQSLVLGNGYQNETKWLEILDGASLSYNTAADVKSGAGILLNSASEINGQGPLNNNGILVSNGERTVIDVSDLVNYGTIVVRSGLLAIMKPFEHYGTMNISELLQLNGKTFINGKVFIPVDGILENPLQVFAPIEFGDDALFHVEVLGNDPKQFSHIVALDQVIRKGKMEIKLLSRFAPLKDTRLDFIRSPVKMEGKFTTVLDVEDWTYPYCIKCRVYQDDFNVGLQCNECSEPEESSGNVDAPSWDVSNRYMGISYLLPGVIVVFVVILLIMGVVEMTAYIREKRRQIRAQIQFSQEEMGFMVLE